MSNTRNCCSITLPVQLVILLSLTLALQGWILRQSQIVHGDSTQFPLEILLFTDAIYFLVSFISFICKCLFAKINNFKKDDTSVSAGEDKCTNLQRTFEETLVPKCKPLIDKKKSSNSNGYCMTCKAYFKCLIYAPPAILYSTASIICWNLQTENGTRAITCNTFIIFTVIFLVIIMKRQFSLPQLFSLLALCISCCFLNTIFSMGNENFGGVQLMNIIAGLCLTCLSALLIALGNVLREWALKQDHQCCIYLQNIQFSGFGLLVNSLVAYLVVTGHMGNQYAAISIQYPAKFEYRTLKLDENSTAMKSVVKPLKFVRKVQSKSLSPAEVSKMVTTTNRKSMNFIQLNSRIFRKGNIYNIGMNPLIIGGKSTNPTHLMYRHKEVDQHIDKDDAVYTQMKHINEDDAVHEQMKNATEISTLSGKTNIHQQFQFVFLENRNIFFVFCTLGAVGAILSSMILKYADNIACIASDCCALLLLVISTNLFFDTKSMNTIHVSSALIISKYKSEKSYLGKDTEVQRACVTLKKGSRSFGVNTDENLIITSVSGLAKAAGMPLGWRIVSIIGPILPLNLSVSKFSETLTPVSASVSSKKEIKDALNICAIRLREWTETSQLAAIQEAALRAHMESKINPLVDHQIDANVGTSVSLAIDRLASVVEDAVVSVANTVVIAANTHTISSSASTKNPTMSSNVSTTNNRSNDSQTHNDNSILLEEEHRNKVNPKNLSASTNSTASFRKLPLYVKFLLLEQKPMVDAIRTLVDYDEVSISNADEVKNDLDIAYNLYTNRPIYMDDEAVSLGLGLAIALLDLSKFMHSI